MSGDIRVFAPVQTVAEVDGISLALLTVEILGHHTTVRFFCPPNERTREINAEHKRQWQAFGPREGDNRPPPEHPMPEMFGSAITLDDGCGTAFEWRGGQDGGRDWLMERIFRPAPAAEASQLTVSITPPGRSTAAVRVPLDGPSAPQ